MTREEAINVLNDYDINFERNTAEEIAEAHEMAIKAIRTIPSEDEKVIRIKKGTLKARTGKYVVYDVEWLKTHFNTTEAKIYGQPSEDCISREALNNAISGLTYWHFENDRLITGGGGSKTETVYKVDDVTRLTHILPSVSSQPKTGRWVLSGGYWRCSECKEKALLKFDKSKGGYNEYGPVKSNYCPKCGIKMVEEQ